MVPVHVIGGISSGSAKADDTFQIQAAEDVVINGMVAIRQGAGGQGHIVEVQAAAGSGRSGSIGLAFDYVYSTDGGRVRLSQTTQKQSEEDRKGASSAATIVGLATFRIGGLFGHHFAHGRQKTIDPKRPSVRSSPIPFMSIRTNAPRRSGTISRRRTTATTSWHERGDVAKRESERCACRLRRRSGRSQANASVEPYGNAARGKRAEGGGTDEQMTAKILGVLDVIAIAVAEHRTETAEHRKETTEHRKETTEHCIETRAGFERVERRLGNLQTRVESLETNVRDFRIDFERRIAPLER